LNLFDSLQSHDFGPDRCFLCAAPLDDESRSEEHVFPKWLQKQFGIRDQRIDLLNRVPVTYRKLTIPCCKTCNNGPLSDLERRVRRHLAAPPRELGKEERTDLFLWVSKILYGLLYRQTTMAFDPADRTGPTILNPTDLRGFGHLQMFLQGIRRGFRYWGETQLPATLYVFELQCPINPARHFDWHDSPATTSICLRLGHRGLVMGLDGGAQELAVGEILARYQNRPLHPFQFEEVGAKFLYKATTAARSPLLSFLDGAKLFCSHLGFDYPEAPSFSTVTELDDGRTQIINVPHPLDDGRPLFGDWDRQLYYATLAHFTGMPLETLLTEDGTGMTWLIDPQGNDLLLSLDNVPYRGELGGIPAAVLAGG
jgi:hypothetical protein